MEQATRIALCLLAQRIDQLTGQILDLERRLTGLMERHFPQLLVPVGIGPDSAATLLITMGDNPVRASLAARRAMSLPVPSRLARTATWFWSEPVLVGQRARETAKGLKPCRRRMWGTTRIMASVARAVVMSPRSSIRSGCQPRSPSRPVTVLFACSSSPER